jgi:replicative DNA helicase
MFTNGDALLERPVPHDPEAERVVCGLILRNNVHRDEAMSLLSIDDFYVPSCRRFFAAVCEMEGLPIDYVTVANHFRANSELESIGGMSFLTGLTYGLPDLPLIKRYATQILEKSLKRRLIKFSNSLTAICLEDEEDAQTHLLWAQASLDEISARANVSGGDFKPFFEVSKEAREYYDKCLSGVQMGLATGFPSLDRATRGGIHPGQLWVISALTGKGKSAWMIGVARHIAAHGQMVGIVSREMSGLENFIRAHSAISGVAVWKIAPNMFPTSHQNLVDTIDDVAELPIFINTDTSNIYDIRAKVKRLVKQGAAVLFVDYLQLLTAQSGSRQQTNRTQEVAACARVLKEIAMDLQIGVVALAQFNRGAANSERPELHQLADSSEIEKASDITLILDMDAPQEGEAVRNCSMRIAKQRNGPEMSLKYRYDGNLLVFSEV